MNRREPLDILLIVDQKWRDLPGMAAFAVWLEDYFGVTTSLIPYSLWRYGLFKHRPQAIVLTHMNGPRTRAIADMAMEMGTRVVVIPTEGRPGNPESMEYAVGKGVDTRGVDLWFTWSDFIRDYMLERNVLAPEKIVVAGVLRFDFYRPILSGLLKTRADVATMHGLDPGRPIISWATNFTHARYHHKNQDFLVKDWKDLGLLKFPSYSNPRDYARKDNEAREQSLTAMEQLLKVRGNVQVILKAHPHEEHDRYVDYVRNCQAKFGPRIAFAKPMYIWDLLNAADIHVHRLCMTGLEAWFLDKPSIDLHLVDYYGLSLQQKGASAEAVEGNDLVQQASGLIERVDYYLGGGKVTDRQRVARERYTQRWLYRIDGHRCEAHGSVLADLIKDRRLIKAPKINSGMIRTFVETAVNQTFGRPLHQSLREWSWGSGPSVDRLGQVDNYIYDQDVEVWKQHARDVLQLVKA